MGKKMVLDESFIKLDVGEVRLDVFTADWNRLKRKFETVSTPKKMLVDDGSVKVDEGEWRVDVYTWHWERLKRALEKVG